MIMAGRELYPNAGSAALWEPGISCNHQVSLLFEGRKGIQKDLYGLKPKKYIKGIKVCCLFSSAKPISGLKCSFVD
jgi:hypothetical protein